MIICQNCNFMSIDFRDFSFEFRPLPRTLKLDPNLTEENRKYMLLKNHYLRLKCPKCRTVYTTKPDEMTAIRLERKEV